MPLFDLTVIAPPATEPVSLAEAKMHCRVEHDAEDALISSLIQAARELVEETTGRALITRTLEWRVDRWATLLYLPYPPAISVVQISYTDAAGATATLPSTAYVLRTGVTPAYIRLDAAQRPAVELARDGAIAIRYQAGYGAAENVPMAFRQAILLLVGHWHLNREAASSANQSELPLAVSALLAPHRLHWFQEWSA